MNRKCADCKLSDTETKFYQGSLYLCALCDKKRQKVSRDKHSRVRPYDSSGYKYHIKAKYGISLDTYEALLQVQNYVCAICGGNGKNRLSVDHDHATGKIRGLLCRACNVGIGNLRDSIDIIEKAKLYLIKHNGQ